MREVLEEVRDELMRRGPTAPTRRMTLQREEVAVITMGQERVAEAALRVQGEYLEMPGLSLTPEQARRLWGLDETACVAILDALVDAQFLRKTARGSYVRREAA